MRRRLFTLCSAVSLLLCAAVCGLWARSFIKTSHVSLDRDGTNFREWHFACERGSITVDDVGGWIYEPEPKLLGFDYRSDSGWWIPAAGSGPEDGRVNGSFLPPTTFVRIPCWFVVATTALLPLLSAREALRRHRRRGDGRCPACGYDLRATSGRCPECGTAVEAAKASA